MRKFLIIGATLATLAAVVATPAAAEDTEARAAVGATAGSVTGGTIGFLLGGPVGAVVGGFVGASVGANVLTRADLEGDVDIQIGDRVGSDVELRYTGDDGYGYFESNGNRYIVDLETAEVIEIRAS